MNPILQEIRNIITGQINRHVSMSEDHRAWLAKDIAGRCCALVEDNTANLRRDSERLGAIIAAMGYFGSRTGSDEHVAYLAIEVPLRVYEKECIEAALMAAFP